MIGSRTSSGGGGVVLALCLILAAAAAHAQVTVDDLLTGAALDLPGERPAIVDGDEVLALSPEMRSFLDAHVDGRARSFVKLNQLAQAIFDEDAFGLAYDGTTRTAAEAFAARRANCLSFTTMFVVLARGVGLDARFQEVDIPPDWSLDHDTYVFNQHINIVLDLGMTGTHVVDFNMMDFRADYETRVISDARALAHYFNNLGVEHMQGDDPARAFLALREALANDRGYAPAWANLGTLYSRRDRPDHAEAAYLEALEADGSYEIAMSNLAAQYERRGDHERASDLRKKVEAHRRLNPYYRFHLARAAVAADDLDEAIHHLKFAARRCREEARFRVLLGLIYLKLGDEGAARKWMARAEKAAALDRGALSGKIERLRRAAQ